ncbi:MAG: ankyrin repeat domain-containing protein, partial [Gammaproteobacteria bacterium]
MTKLLRALGMVFFAAVIGGAVFADGGLSLLHYVAAFGNPDILLAFAVPVSGLHLAVEKGDIAEFKRLIADGADIDAKDKLGMTLLHWAAEQGQTQAALFFVNAGADVNAKDIFGDTPLHIAASSGKTETVLALVNAGADIRAKNIPGRTPFNLAIYHGQTKTAITLVKAGADIDAKDKLGMTDLHWAAKHGRTQTALTLVNAGAAIGAKDNYGWTPLHRAARHSQTETIIALVKAGADIGAKNNSGETPLCVAERFGHTETARALVKAAADIKAKSDDSGTHSRSAVYQPAAQSTKTGAAAGDFHSKFPAPYRTTDGRFVRSRAEVMIANYLFHARITYIYERKLPVKEIVYCDFYLPDKKIYIEYWGLENDPEYLKRKRKKLAVYKKYAFNLIQLHDNEVQNLDYHLSRLL